ncbi:hypothetical protein SISNIDRAFT_465558 [Sistotremastrum niveocremeum HHB9708]|uniref:Uncharacterized protein n=1 Tax=Sistotremastrum niveocremeum HHB9708 TaxID=1314777 RepID=A0A164VAD9_9AGAM|nr:hypothetical protein SISNIDRAFT_465558 [Sistotremastrum niveocremeum HHB9708]
MCQMVGMSMRSILWYRIWLAAIGLKRQRRDDQKNLRGNQSNVFDNVDFDLINGDTSHIFFSTFASFVNVNTILCISLNVSRVGRYIRPRCDTRDGQPSQSRLYHSPHHILSATASIFLPSLESGLQIRNPQLEGQKERSMRSDATTYCMKLEARRCRKVLPNAITAMDKVYGVTEFLDGEPNPHLCLTFFRQTARANPAALRMIR